MKTIINFLLKSSANPEAVSLTVRAFLLAIIPYVMQALDVVCAFGNQCYAIDASLLTIIFNAIAQAVFYILTLISTFGVIYGACRKLYRTATGNNLALQN